MAILEVNLYYDIHPSDKVYNIYLKFRDGSFHVSSTYGRRMGSISNGQGIETGVSFPKALAVFESLLNSKLKKGYHITDSRNDFGSIVPIPVVWYMKGQPCSGATAVGTHVYFNNLFPDYPLTIVPITNDFAMRRLSICMNGEETVELLDLLSKLFNAPPLAKKNFKLKGYFCGRRTSIEVAFDPGSHSVEFIGNNDTVLSIEKIALPEIVESLGKQLLRIAA